MGKFLILMKVCVKYKGLYMKQFFCERNFFWDELKRSTSKSSVSMFWILAKNFFFKRDNGTLKSENFMIKNFYKK